MDPEDDYKPRKEGVGFPTFPGKTREWEAWEPEEIDEKKLKAVLKTILKESNLELDQLHKISEGEWEAYAVNRLGNRVGIIIWTKYMPFVEKEDVEDLYEAMLEYKLQHAVFITTSHFTKNAQEFAEDLPIELVDGRNLGELVPEAELYEVEDVFVTDKGNQEAVDYFKTRRKKKLLGIIGDAETIEYIDRRYLPFAVYTIGKPKRPQEEESKNLFVDLSTAEIPYVEERNLMVVDTLRTIMELPDKSREHLLDLIQYGGLSLKHVEGKHLEILEKKNLVISPAARSGEKSFLQIIGEELGDTFQVMAEDLSKMPQPRERPTDYSKYQHQPGAYSREGLAKVRANIHIPQVDRPFDLEHFLESSKEVDSNFDPDSPRYNVAEIRDVLERIYGEKVTFKKIIYMPYFLCKYSTIYTTRYLRYISPAFRSDIFPPKTSEYGIYEFIDKQPVVPYIVLGLMTFIMNLHRIEYVLHLFSSVFIFVSISIALGILLKAIFRTPRRVPRYGGSPIKYGFPSIHSMLSAGSLGFIFFVNPLFLIMLIPLTLLYLYSRIALGVHNVSDVIGGSIIGLILGVSAGILIYQGLKLPLELETFFTILFFILPLFYGHLVKESF
ncbi:MAG: hypothetical protein B6U97_03750 [Candidatus Altiarchaeales archaeon ex4484_96]|nr:MAG: hypothetical protein B6U97_03750 [Candidatus Altiarchaeales archaeon ex4484_96]